MTMRFRLLGPLQVDNGGGSVRLNGPKRRALTAFLLVHRDTPSPIERIVDALWEGNPSPGAEATIRTYVSQLRRLFADDGPELALRHGGYVLDVDPDCIDTVRFERAVSNVLAEPAAPRRVACADEALQLWRGAPLDEFVGAAWADDAAHHWTRLRMLVLERRVDALLEMGRTTEALVSVETAVNEHPLHEPLWIALMLARYRCGRQADALRAAREARQVLASELGIDPGPELVDLEQRILTQDPALLQPNAPSSTTARRVAADLAMAASQEPGPEIRYAKSGAVDIAYQTFGTGPPDLLLFSSAVLPIDSMNDEPLLYRFHKRLASFSRVIRFDVRGVGMSDPITAADPPTLEQWAQDALAVLDAVESEQAAVFAPRDSSLAGLLLATTYPDRVHALVLVNGTARLSRAPDYPVGIPARLLENFLEVNMEPDAVEQGMDFLADAAPSVSGDAEFRTWWRRAGNRGASPSTARAIQSAYVWADVRPLLPLLRMPTLIMHRRENILNRVGHGRYLAQHLPQAKYLELPGADDLYWVGDTETMLDEIEEFLTGARPGPRTDRVLLTVLLTDIVGSTAQIAHLGDRRWRELIDQQERAMRRQLVRFRGREVKTTGDGVLATFDGPARAVSCACAIREASAQLGLEIRAGVHTGEVELRGDDIGGLAVHIAARIAGLAEPRQVLTSRTVVDLMVGSGITTREHGEHSLKGVPGRWPLFEVEA